MMTSLTHGIFDSLGFLAFSDDELIDVDDQPDATLQNHRREQMHVDASHFLLPQFPERRRCNLVIDGGVGGHFDSYLK